MQSRHTQEKVTAVVFRYLDIYTSLYLAYYSSLTH